ncbi:hypothetical protein HDN1F_09530 [gamma proteobacterium HdN1]|nr:hypothetical protein HDN1F_09530 [gamma proteobacterium HdN1]
MENRMSAFTARSDLSLFDTTRKGAFVVCLASTLFASTAALAAPPAQQGGRLYGNSVPHAVFSAAVHFGGDDLAVVYSRDETEKIEAGGGYLLGLGIEFPLVPNEIALRTGVSYLYDSIDADNGKAEFKRLPWDAIVLFGNQFRFGVGATYHTVVEYEFRQDWGQRISANFEDELGLVALAEIAVMPNFTVHLRYTDIEYTSTGRGRSAKTVDGSGFGVGFNVLF